MGIVRESKNVTTIIEIEKRWIGKLLQYNCPNPHIIFLDEHVCNVSKFNKNMLYYGHLKETMKKSPIIRSKEFTFYEYGTLVLLIDIEERKGLGGRQYRLYKTLYGDQTNYFILSQEEGELSMYFRPFESTNV